MRPLKLVPDNTNIHFLKWRFWAMGLSLTLIALSIVLVAVRGFNFGVDFVGGQMVRVSFAEAANIDELRTRVGALGFGEASIQEFGKPTDVQIRLPLPPGDEAAAIGNDLSAPPASPPGRARRRDLRPRSALGGPRSDRYRNSPGELWQDLATLDYLLSEANLWTGKCDRVPQRVVNFFSQGESAAVAPIPSLHQAVALPVEHRGGWKQGLRQRTQSEWLRVRTDLEPDRIPKLPRTHHRQRWSQRQLLEMTERAVQCLIRCIRHTLALPV